LGQNTLPKFFINVGKDAPKTLGILGKTPRAMAKQHECKDPKTTKNTTQGLNFSLKYFLKIESLTHQRNH
jgi:hypothetical protein